MNDYCVRESTETVMANPQTQTLRAIASNVSGALKEANLILDKLFCDMFGLSPNSTEDKKPPINCFEAELRNNLEQSKVVADRLAQLNARMFD